MAVTKGHGNPKWNREETILALDLYFRLEGETTRSSEAHVLELSKFLRELPYHSKSRRNSTFRNIDGVKFKFQNLRSALTGEGLSNISKMDRAVADEFGGKSHEVRRLASLIRSNANELSMDDFEVTDDFDEEFYEGKSVFAVHRKVERNRSLRKSFLSKLSDLKLACAICGLSRPQLERELSEALFEIHHLIPLGEIDGLRRTRLSDVSLLCACCHRGIHKLMNVNQRSVSIEEARKLLFP